MNKKTVYTHYITVKRQIEEIHYDTMAKPKFFERLPRSQFSTLVLWNFGILMNGRYSG